MMTPHERYLNDPLFHRLVELLYLELQNGALTPTEIREAAVLAQIRYEQERPRLLPKDEPTLDEILRNALIPLPIGDGDHSWNRAIRHIAESVELARTVRRRWI